MRGWVRPTVAGQLTDEAGLIGRMVLEAGKRRRGKSVEVWESCGLDAEGCDESAGMQVGDSMGAASIYRSSIVHPGSGLSVEEMKTRRPVQ